MQITNYGPIDQFDIELPFESDVPKPVLLVGGNGSGKSIVLSHIVNGLISAQSETYPGTPEVEQSRVYKYRSSSYIRSEREFYFAKVDFKERDKTSLDIFWLKDKSLTDLDNLPEPDELAEEIIENLESGLNSFREVFSRL